MFSKQFSSLVVFGLGAIFLIQATDPEPEVNLDGIKCIVSGEKPADSEYPMSYLDGTLYFSSDACAKAFETDQASETPELTLKANHQLVITKQYAQLLCPVSGNILDDTSVIRNIAGIEIGFYSEDCAAEIDELETLPAKANLVFGADAFTSTFGKALIDELDEPEPVPEVISTELPK